MAVPAPTEPPQPPHLYALESPPPDDGPDPVRTAERAVLGAALTNPRDLDDLTQILNPNDFERPAHELIFAAAIHLHARQKPVDPITISDHLGRDTRRVGGTTYLHELAIAAPIAGSATYHAQIVTHAAARRRATTTAAAIVDMWARARTDEPLTDLHAATLERWEALRHTIPGVDTEATPHTWSPVDLTSVLDGTHATPTATLMTRRDGKALLYPAAVHSLAGEPGSAKTWAALVGVAQELEQGHPCLYIDHEDRPSSIVNRLLSLGATPDQIGRQLRYIRPETALDAAGWTAVAKAAEGARLAVIDGITEAMVLHGFETNSNDDAAAWLALIPNRLAGLGLAVVQIDHVTKNSDTRGRYAIGAQHKLAGITGTAYKVLIVKAMAKGAKGHAKIVIDKDKHGDVGPVGVTVADLHLDATDSTGVIRAWFDTPGSDHDDEGRFRPTVLMGRVSAFLEGHPGSTGAAVRGGVRGKATAVLEALDCLVREGFVRAEDAPRGGSFYYSVELFEDPS